MTETPNPNIIDADTLTGEMRPIRRAVLALGSNLGDRMGALQGAVDTIADTPDVWVTSVSPVYETEPVDSPEDSPMFLNAVLLLDTTLAAHRLLDRALAVEDAYDRERSEVRNAPRTLDVDIIVVGDRRADDDQLQLPHPRAHERAFVLRPWHDVEPDGRDPRRRVGQGAARRPRRLRDDAPGGPGARAPVTRGSVRRGAGRATSRGEAAAHVAGHGRRVGDRRPGRGLAAAPGRRPGRQPAGGRRGCSRSRCSSSARCCWRPRGSPTAPSTYAGSGWSRTARSTGWCWPGPASWWADWWPAATRATP